ncbi:MAG: hypothetical protein JOY82_24835 [Streptosporangiaceae bacterium]|nr:hypothetical protein [Streptosporangiaceae bacterium]MBV9857711.1 hypothetical protein [Streptosporangiaceae bacterium]
MTAGPGRVQHALRAMRAGLSPEPALRLSTGGLLLMATAGKDPLRADDLTGAARAQLHILRDRGIIGNAGTPTEAAAPAVRAMAAPNVRLTADIGVATGRATWSAWLGAERAVVAVRTDPAGDDLAVFIVPPGWAPVMAVRWLGVGPRPQPPAGGAVALPADLLRQRLAERATPPPPEAARELRTLWSSPLRLWGVRAEPGHFGMLILDAGRAGYWQLTDAPADGSGAGEQERVTLTPLTARDVWRRVVHSAVSADVYRRKHAGAASGRRG